MDVGDFRDCPVVKSPQSVRKRRFDPAWKEQLVLACLRPGVSVSKMALENNINANQLRNWIRNHRQSRQGIRHGIGRDGRDDLSRSAFLPVIEGRALQGGIKNSAVVVPAARPDPRPEGIDKKPAGSGAQLSASLPNGVKLSVEVSDASILTVMIGVLGNVPSVG